MDSSTQILKNRHKLKEFKEYKEDGTKSSMKLNRLAINTRINWNIDELNAEDHSESESWTQQRDKNILETWGKFQLKAL